MLRKKNIKTFMLLTVMFYGPIAEMYADLLADIPVISKIDESNKQVAAGIEALNNVALSICDNKLLDSLDARYAQFCKAKNDKYENMEKYPNWPLRNLYEPSFRMAEECCKAANTTIEDRARRDRETLYNLVETIQKNINETSVYCLKAEPVLNKRLKLDNLIVNFFGYFHLGGIVKKVCNAFEVSNPLEKCYAQKEKVEESIDKIKNYEKNCMSYQSYVSETFHEIYDMVNQRRISLLEETHQRYRYEEGSTINISSLPQIKKQISSSQLQHVSGLDNIGSSLRAYQKVISSAMLGGYIGLYGGLWFKEHFGLQGGQAKGATLLGLSLGLVGGLLYCYK